MNNKSIFIQIASYRDTELLPTINDLLSKSSGQYPLFFGICWQRDTSDNSLIEFTKKPNFRINDIHWSKSKGLGWARLESQKLYNNEDYVLQIDSHSRFIENWDIELVDMLEKLKSKSEKPLLTTYGFPYEPEQSLQTKVLPYKLVPIAFKKSGTIFFEKHPIKNAKEPINARFIGGGFFFTVGSHCKEYVYDPNLYFAGDELCLSLRSYTLGYDLYHPHKHILWHFYKRVNHIKHWNDHNRDKNKDIEKHWWETDTISKKRLIKLIEGQDLGIYGCGKIRSIKDYSIYAGIDFEKRRIITEATEGKDPPVEYHENGFIKNQKIHIEVEKLPESIYLVNFINLEQKVVDAKIIDKNSNTVNIKSDHVVMKYDIIGNNKIIFSKELRQNIAWH